MFEREVFENGVVLTKDEGYVSLKWYVQNEDYPELNDSSELRFKDDGTLVVSCNEDKRAYKFTGTPVFTETTTNFGSWCVCQDDKEQVQDLVKSLGVTLV